MSVRLAVFQRESRPLEGLCAQLQCAGYDVFERYTTPAVLDLVTDTDIDIFLIDAEARDARKLVDRVRNDDQLTGVPIMLTVSDSVKASSCASWHDQIDDIVLLPIDRSTLRMRIGSLARMVSMAGELQRRRELLADFGVTSRSDAGFLGTGDRIDVLIVGSEIDDQIDLLTALGGAITAAYATTAQQALTHLGRSQVDLVIVTAGTPAPEVRALFRETRAKAASADLPILLVADHAATATLEAISPFGEAELLSMPLHPAIIRQRIQVLTRQWRLRRQLRGMMVDSLYAPIVDGLTGLYAYGFFHHYLSRSIAVCRERDLPLSIVTLTLTGLSNLNESNGYPAGDQLLRDLGFVLASSCRAQDLAARIGGTQAGIVLSDTSEHEAGLVCNRLLENLNQALQRSSGKQQPGLQVVASIAELSSNDDSRSLARRALEQRRPETLSRAS